LLLGVALAVASYVFGIRPFLDHRQRSVDVLGWVAGTATTGLAVRTALGVALPAAAYAVPDPLHLDELTGSGSVDLPGGGVVAVRTFPVLAIALAVAVLTDWFVRRSSTGRAIRAVADDVDAAELCGVPVGRVVLIAFVLAGALAAVAG